MVAWRRFNKYVNNLVFGRAGVRIINLRKHFMHANKINFFLIRMISQAVL